jgi:hypothetical protein
MRIKKVRDDAEMDGITTEIRTFYSAREIRENVEAEINQYKDVVGGL